jgi:hypothetical protein
MPFLIGDDLVSTLGILQNSIATISSNGVYELDEEALLSMNFYIGKRPTPETCGDLKQD